MIVVKMDMPVQNLQLCPNSMVSNTIDYWDSFRATIMIIKFLLSPSYTLEGFGDFHFLI